jgi:hypothetical protein
MDGWLSTPPPAPGKQGTRSVDSPPPTHGSSLQRLSKKLVAQMGSAIIWRWEHTRGHADNGFGPGCTWRQ